MDDDQLDAALDELEDRYVIGEGAPHESTIRMLRETAHARRSRDIEAIEALCAPGFTVIDHRRIGYGTMDADAMRTAQQARIDQTTDDQSLHRWREIRGDVVFAELATVGTTPDGNEYEWSFLVIWQLGAAGWIRLEMFDLEDPDAVRRFDELTTEPA